MSRGIRRKREPGTRNPLSWPESKQRMIVCWLTLQIFAASPVVKTVFIVHNPFCDVLPHGSWALPTSAGHHPCFAKNKKSRANGRDKLPFNRNSPSF